MKKRMISMLLVLSMVASTLLSTNVFVNAAQTGDLTTDGEYQNTNWNPGGDGEITYDINGTPVTLSKRIEPVAGKENTFEVTLKVETSTNTVVTTSSGAVVLVIDTSGSMDYCADCGSNNTHDEECANYKKYNNNVSNSQSRMTAAKNAALEFLKSYAGEDASADRRLAIVTFATNYSTALSWVNVAGGSGKNDYNKAENAINNLYANGGTNLEGGLYTALNNIKADSINNVASKSVVLLTDGVPTFRISGGNGTYGSKQNNQAAADQAANIKDQGATLYTVCFGVANESTYSGGPTVGNFLSGSVASSGRAYNADNTAELYAAFGAITESIITGMDGAGWSVMDPMGEMYDITGTLPENFSPVGGKTYEWKLSEPEVSTSGGSTTYVYTCKYQVVLNVLHPDFQEGEFYPANGPTSLKTNGHEYGFDFPVPGAKGDLPRMDIPVEKVWNDQNNQDGLRPGSVTLQLLKNGQPAETLVLDASKNWKGTFENMEVYQNGTPVVYTVKELDIAPNYASEVSGSAEAGFVVTNTQKVVVSGSKTWNDANDQDGIRPASITIHLLKNGTVIDSRTVTAADNWKWEFKNLDKYESGKTINYAIVEDGVEGYTTVVNGYNVTNTHVPAVISIYGAKTWNDNDNQDGLRPEKVIINLLADDKEVKEIEVSAATEWTYEFIDLPKYENGRAIVYTITEDTVAGYESQIDGYNVTNTHVPEQTSVKVTKVWDDGNNQDGNRPESVEIHLHANGVHIDTAEVKEAEDWTYTWTNLAKYQDGKEITYMVFEEPGSEYKVKITGNAAAGFIVTNSYTPAVVNIDGIKAWNDGDDQDGIRPESVTVNLLANGKEIKEITVSAATNWVFEIYDLPKYENGKEIKYTITEDAVTGYTSQIDGYVITNTHVPEQTEVKVTKVWDDANDQDGKRPESVEIHLHADGTHVATAKVEEADNWTYTFTDLPKYENGKEIHYAVYETPGSAYKVTITGDAKTGYIVTNSYTPDEVNIEGAKVWDDAHDQDGLRPASVTVNLLANGKKVKELTVTEATNWTYEFYGLPKYEAGVEIEYTVTEIDVPGYTTKIDGFVITNTHVPLETSVQVTKVWDDGNNQDGNRPDSVLIHLHANGTHVATAEVKEAENWKYTFTNLPKYANGQEIEYTVFEDPGSEYKVTIMGNAQFGFIVTNSYTPEVVHFDGVKMWNDGHDQDGIRPDKVTINLLANGKEIQEIAVTEANNWAYEIYNLPKYENGAEIKYTVTEDAVAGYTSQIDGFVITNTHVPEETEVKVTKVWDDEDDQDGKRPESVEIHLHANDTHMETVEVKETNSWTYTWTDLPKYENGKEIHYTVYENPGSAYKVTVTGDADTGYIVTNSYKPVEVNLEGVKVWDDAHNQDGLRPESVTINLLADGNKIDEFIVSDATNWTYEFNGLPQFKSGVEIEYTVTEEAVVGYTTDIKGFVITNSHVPEQIEIKVTKVWDDADNQDGNRPEEVEIHLHANGVHVKSAKVSETTGWIHTWSDMPKYENGKEIHYAVYEEPGSVYQVSISGDVKQGFTITNSYKPAVVHIDGVKVWNDGNDQDGIRPESVTVNLLANGNEVKEITVSAATNWAFAIYDLPKYENGKEIQYTVTEDAVAGYTTQIDGFVITNTHVPEQTAVKVTKVWDDANDQDGNRPEFVEIHLHANGTHVATAKVEEADNWTYTFTDLPKYENGKEIHYAVYETPGSAYKVAITGDAKTGYIVTNSYRPAEVNLEGAKVWNDADDQDGIRPESVTINLLANGVKIKEVTVTEATDWTYQFYGLPKYENGKEIKYTVTENEVPGYTTEINGFVITNSHVPEETSVQVTKAWDDGNNQDGNRPDFVTIHLHANGAHVASAQVKEAEDWKHIWTNLPKYEHGKKIEYAVFEDPGSEYKVTTMGNAQFGFIVVNSYTPEVVHFDGAKIWNDDDNRDGIRPESVTINLLANGKEVKEITVTAATDWAYEFYDLPKSENGKVIEYTITEDAVNGYTSQINGFNVTNTHAPEQTSVKVTKVWDDANNQDGNRPDFVTIHLHANGYHVASAEVKEAEGWTYTWTGLNKYHEGKAINYTVMEERGSEYTVTITGDAEEGYVVTNSYKPQTITVEGTKTWNDANNQDGIRPERIMVTLLANGVAKGTLTVTAEDNWRYSWPELPKYNAGTEIRYTVSETPVDKYITQNNRFDLINTHEVEKTSYTVSKIWQDQNDQDGIRPDMILVQLFANGEKAGDAIALNADNQWTYTWNELDKYTKGEVGKEVVYTVDEVEVPQGYTKSVEDSTIINTHIPDAIDFSVTKVWRDGFDQDQLRPESIQVQLYADGIAQGEAVTLSEENGWTYSWTYLPKNAAGQPIAYTVQEVNVPEGYTSVVDGGMITNIHEVEKVVLAVSKTQSVNGDTITGETLNVKAGEIVTYYVTVRNDSKVAVRGIVIDDAIPAGLSYVEGSADKGGAVADGVITWTVGELAAGESVTVSFKVIVPETEKDAKWKNVATVTYRDGTPDQPGEEFDSERRKTVDTNGVTIVQIHSVDTGDHSDMSLWTVMTAMSVLLLGALVIAKKKNNYV